MPLGEWGSFGEWGAAAPVTAALALAVLAVVPHGPSAPVSGELSALELAAPGETVTWEDGESSASIKVSPALYRGADGVWCRPYRLSVTEDGTTVTSRQVACRQPDGSWRPAPAAARQAALAMPDLPVGKAPGGNEVAGDELAAAP